MKRWAALVRRVPEHPLLPVALALMAMLLCAPSLRIGWILDDYLLRAALETPEQIPEAARSPTDLFAWTGERWLSTPGLWPWWAGEDFRVAFFRPLTGLTHWLDFRLWPQDPWWMHLQSLLWLGLTVIAATLLYRNLHRRPEYSLASEGVWIAGLASLFFALDDVRSIPAIWISNRNALLAVFFGLLTLLAHHRWRRDGWRPGAFLAPVALLLAVLSGEAAVACGAYLVSYALFLDRGPMSERLKALVPCAVVGVLWQLVYRALGYGVAGSGGYIDPGTEPLRFLGALLERGPILLWGLFGYPTPDLYMLLSQSTARRAWLVVVLVLGLFGLILAPLLRRDARARFWAFGLLLALPPSCAVYPNNRLLGYVSLGGAGLLASFIVHAWRRGDGLPAGWRPMPWKVVVRLLTLSLLYVHLVQSPKTTWATTANLAGLDTFLVGAAVTLPSEPVVREQQAVIVNAPSFHVVFYAPTYQALRGRDIPRSTLTLATSIYPIEVCRLGPRSLAVRPHGGFLPPIGSAPPGQTPPPINTLYYHQLFDTYFRDDEPFRVGQRLERSRVDLEILEVTDLGRPVEVAFHFDVDLEDDSLLWLEWANGGFIPWWPPAVGETVTLPEFWRRR